ncbi:MAG: hypothetical protein K6E63_06720 [Lachnospiraceae bacterium]|nr:hypothetical protein [Lachnospiraceae bacterium]
MNKTQTHTKIWNRIIGMLLVLTMTIPGSPALMALAATETAYDVAAADTDLTNAADVNMTDSGALAGQVEEDDTTIPEEVPDGIQNRQIGDYNAKDDFQSTHEITYYTRDNLPDPTEPLFDGFDYSVTYVLEEGAALIENAAQTISAASNDKIVLGADNVVTQTFVKNDADPVAPLVYTMPGKWIDSTQTWYLTYKKTNYSYESGELIGSYESTEKKYFSSTAVVKDLQNYADKDGKISLYPNWRDPNVVFDEASLNGVVNPNASIISFEKNSTVTLQPITELGDAAGLYEFTGWKYKFGNETLKDAAKAEDGTFLIQTENHAITAKLTIYASWSEKEFTVSVQNIQDITFTYGIEADVQMQKFKENTTLAITPGEALSDEARSRLEEYAWKGAVWFYAPKYVKTVETDEWGSEKDVYVDNTDAVISPDTTVSDLRKSKVWTEITATDPKLNAGDYYLVLAFDESRFTGEASHLAAGSVCRGILDIEKIKLVFELYDITGTSTTVSIPFEEPTDGVDEFGKPKKIGQPFNPSEYFTAKAFYADTGEFFADLVEFSVYNENSSLHEYLWGDSCNLEEKPKSDPGIKFYIASDAIFKDHVKMVDVDGNVVNNANYTARKRSNTVEVCTFVVGEGDLTLGDGYYAHDFYFPTDEFMDTLTDREFADDFVYVYQSKKLVQDYQNMQFALLPDSYAKTPEERTKEFEKILAEGLSVSEQLKAIAAKNPSDLYAGKKLYVAVSHKSLGLSSVKQNDYYLYIWKQPVIFTNAEEIKGLKGKGIIREYGGVNKYGGYNAKLNIGIIDRAGKPVLKESGTVKTVKDYSASYSWAGTDYQAENLQSVSSWLNGTYRSYMEIKLGKYGESGQVPYNIGNKQIELSFSYLKNSGLFTNFTLYGDQKYSVYHIADSRNVSFSDFEGNKLRDPLLVEVTQDKDGKNILSFEVASFKGFDGTDKSTKDVKWYCTDADGKMTCIPEAAVAPLAKEGTTDVFTGAKFTLDTDSYGEAIKLCAKINTVEEGDFWVKPINPVFYTGVKMVGRQDTLKMGKATYNCSVDIRVMSGTGEAAKELVYNTDYTLGYNSNTNAGTAKVTVIGKGAYKGKKTTASFAILPARFDNAAFVTEKKKTIEFTGKSIDSSMTGTSYFKVYLSYDGKTQVSRTEYTPKVVEYKIADDGTILAKDSLEEYNKYDKNIRYFDVYAVASKDGNFLKGDTCGEDLKVGENLYEHMDRVDVIGTRRGGVKLSYFGLRTAIDYNSKATLKNFADLSKKTVYVKYNKTSGSEKIYLTDKRLKVELYKVRDDGTREFICSGADYDKVKLPGSGDYILRIGPKYYDENGNTIQGGSLYSVGVYSTLEVKLKMRGIKLSSTVVKVDSKSLTLDPEGTVLQLDINPKRKAYFDPAKVLLCYSGIENGSYTVGEGDEELEFYDGSTVKTTIPLMRNGKQLTLADVCVDGVYSINLAEFTDSFGNSLNAVGTGAIVFVSSGGKFYGSYSSKYTIKDKK